KDLLELDPAGVREQQRWVVGRDQRRTRPHDVSVALEKRQKAATDLGGAHMRGIYEVAGGNPNAELDFRVLTESVHGPPDLVGIEAPSGQKGVEPTTRGDVVQLGQCPPLLFGDPSNVLGRVDTL